MEFQVLAGDERLGLRRGAGVRPDEPMDTIFVKNVRENGPASVAGLSTGDRIISVNGETVAGKSYAHVVQVIQQSQCYLYLLVVPMENDILQLVSVYYIYIYVWYIKLFACSAHVIMRVYTCYVHETPTVLYDNYIAALKKKLVKTYTYTAVLPAVSARGLPRSLR